MNLSNYYYYPSLLSGWSELTAYRELSDLDKRRILPIIELSRRRNASDLEAAQSDVSSTFANRPFILDLDKRPAPAPYISKMPSDPLAETLRVEQETASQRSYNAILQRLLNPTNGFSAWRELVAEFPNAIPTLQYDDVVTQGRQILRQAAFLSSEHQNFVFRIRRDGVEHALEIAIQIAAILRDPGQMLIIFDCGQGRIEVKEKERFVIEGVQRITAEIELPYRSSFNFVCMSNSFPTLAHNGLTSKSNIDRRIWQSVRDIAPVAFGDYAAVNRPNAYASYMVWDWRATVVLAKNTSWNIYRHINAKDPNGWIEGAQSLVADVSFPGVGDCWGNDLIAAASEGNITLVDAPRFWHAAKINSHIHRQIMFSPSDLGTDEEGDEG